MTSGKVTSNFLAYPSVISSLVKNQLGNMTFQEAYEKTRRVLNVIIPFEGGRRSILMNFLTTPNVVVWTAAVASNSQGSFPGLWGEVGILCKDELGEIVPWDSDGIPPCSHIYLTFSWKRPIHIKSQRAHFREVHPFPVKVNFVETNPSPEFPPHST